MSSRLSTLSLVLSFTCLTALAGCKQGEGDRCQIDSDCEDGLRCSAQQDICTRPAGGSVDAGDPNASDAAGGGEADAAPSPADAAPNPADAAPNPADAAPSPADAAPEPDAA